MAAVLADNSLQEAEALLEELVDTHLLEAAHTPGRYRFHDLLRLYARERVEAEDDDSARSAARRRMLTWYLDTITPTDYVFAPRRGGPLHERGEVWPDLMYSTTAHSSL